jgi:hypothetical protein
MSRICVGTGGRLDKSVSSKRPLFYFLQPGLSNHQAFFLGFCWFSGHAPVLNPTVAIYLQFVYFPLSFAEI